MSRRQALPLGFDVEAWLLGLAAMSGLVSGLMTLLSG